MISWNEAIYKVELRLVLPRRWAPSPTFVTGDSFGGNYWRLITQPSSPAMIRAMDIKKFWYSSPKFIAQPHELSFMSEKM